MSKYGEEMTLWKGGSGLKNGRCASRLLFRVWVTFKKHENGRLCLLVGE
jgi:hypothetical protein